MSRNRLDQTATRHAGDTRIHTATHCNTVYVVAIKESHYHALQHTTAHCNAFLVQSRAIIMCNMGTRCTHTATHCTTLQHTQHSNTLHHPAEHTTQQHMAPPCSTRRAPLQHTATCCDTFLTQNRSKATCNVGGS